MHFELLFVPTSFWEFVGFNSLSSALLDCVFSPARMFEWQELVKISSIILQMSCAQKFLTELYFLKLVDLSIQDFPIFLLPNVSTNYNVNHEFGSRWTLVLFWYGYSSDVLGIFLRIWNKVFRAKFAVHSLQPLCSMLLSLSLSLSEERRRLASLALRNHIDRFEDQPPAREPVETAVLPSGSAQLRTAAAVWPARVCFGPRGHGCVQDP